MCEILVKIIGKSFFRTVSADQKKFISTKEASSIVGRSSDYVGKLAREGKIPASRIGRAWVVNREALLEFFDLKEVKKEIKNEKLSQSRKEEYVKVQKNNFLEKFEKIPFEAAASFVIATLIVFGGYSLAGATGLSTVPFKVLDVIHEKAFDVHRVIVRSERGPKKIYTNYVVSNNEKNEASYVVSENIFSETFSKTKLFGGKFEYAGVQNNFASTYIPSRNINFYTKQDFWNMYKGLGEGVEDLAHFSFGGYEDFVRALGKASLANAVTARDTARAASEAVFSFYEEGVEDFVKVSQKFPETHEALTYGFVEKSLATARTFASVPYKTGGLILASAQSIPEANIKIGAGMRSGSPQVGRAIMGSYVAFIYNFVENTHALTDTYKSAVEFAGNRIGTGYAYARFNLPDKTLAAANNALDFSTDVIIAQIELAGESLASNIFVPAVEVVIDVPEKAGNSLAKSSSRVSVLASGAKGLVEARLQASVLGGVKDVFNRIFGRKQDPVLLVNPGPAQTNVVVKNEEPTYVAPRNITQNFFASTDVNRSYVDTSITALHAALSAELQKLTSLNRNQIVQNIQTIQWVNKIEDISDTIIRRPEIIGGFLRGVQINEGSTFSGTSVSAGTGTFGTLTAATTTFTGPLTIPTLVASGTTTLATTTLTGPLTGTTGTFTSATTTNFFATNASTTNATSTNLFATNATFTSATSTNFYSSVLSALTATLTNLTATNATTTNATTTNLAISGLTAGSIPFIGTGGIVVEDNSNFFFDNGNSRLGVGTATPATSVDINATDAIRIPVGTSAQRPGTSLTGQIRYNSTTAQYEGYNGSNWLGLGGVIDIDQDTYVTAEESSDEDFLRFYTAGTERFTIDNQGRVGIGTTSPESLLNIQVADSSLSRVDPNSSVVLEDTDANFIEFVTSGANSDTGLVFSNSGGATDRGWVLYNSGDLSLRFGTDVQERLRIDAAGNVGIGTTSPYAKLSVVGEAVAEYFTATSTSVASTFPRVTSTYGTTTNATSTNLSVSGTFNAVTGGAQSSGITVDSNGYVGINNTTPLFPLDVKVSASKPAIFRADTEVRARFVANGSNVGLINGYTGDSFRVFSSSGLPLHLGYNETTQFEFSSGQVDSSVAIIPTANATYDLGSPAYYWDDAYFDSATINNLSSASTSIAGTNNASFSINSDNATSDGEDASLVFYRGVVVPNAVIGWDASEDHFDFNQNIFIQNDNGGIATSTLTIRAASGQTGNLFTVQNTAGLELANFGVDGYLGLGSSTPTVRLTVGTGTPSSLSAANYYNSGYVTGDLEVDGTIYGTVSGAITPAGFTEGSVVFAGSGGTLTQDNSNFFWDDSTNRLGIGTTSPYAKLSVVGEVVAEYFTATSTSATSTLPNFGTTNIAIGSDYINDITGNGLSVSGGVLNVSTTSLASGFFQQGGNSFGASAVLGTNDSNSLAFETGGSTRVLLDTSGNVGIGTTSPYAKLSVTGPASGDSFVVADSSNNTDFVVTADGKVGFGIASPNAAYYQFAAPDNTLAVTFSDPNGNFRHTFGTDSNADPYWRSFNGTDLNLGIDSTNVLTIASTTNQYHVGISTSTPWAKFSVVNTYATPSFVVADEAGDATPFLIDASGNVGIGTSSPAFELDVAGEGRFVTGNTVSAVGLTVDSDDDANDVIFKARSNSTGSPTDSDTKFIITGDGLVGVGTTAPEALFHVATPDSTSPFILERTGANAVKLQVVVGSNDLGIIQNSQSETWISGADAGVGYKISESNAFGTDDRFTIARTTGDVGIGTSAPQTAFHIYSSSSGNQALIERTSAADVALGFKNTEQEWAIGIDRSDSNTFKIGGDEDNIGNSNRFAITTGGNVGIGTTTPSSKLHVSGSSNIATIESTATSNIAALTVKSYNSSYDGLIQFARGSSYQWFAGIRGANSDFVIDNASVGNEAFLIDAATNNVGLGTVSPAEELTVSATSTADNRDIFIRVDADDNYKGGIKLSSGIGDDDWAIQHDDNAYGNTQTLDFLYAGNSRFLISGDGNVGIGTTTPEVLLHVVGANDGHGLVVEESNTVGGNGGTIESRGTRSDNNSSLSFGGAFYATRYRNDAANARGASDTFSQLGNIAFGGNHTDGTVSNIAYAASIGGLIEDTFNSDSDMPTALVFRTGSAGIAKGTTNGIIGTERVRIDSSGNVGIGTTTPSTALSFGENSAISFYDASGSQHAEIGNIENLPISVTGTNVDNPDFYISGGSSNDLIIASQSNTTGEGIRFGNTDRDTHAFTEYLTILGDGTGAGNVGIGTTSPQSILHVANGFSGQATPNGSANELVVENSSNAGISILSPSANTGNIYFGDEAAAAVGRITYDHSDNSLTFRTSAADRLSIDSTGNVGIGTTTPNSITFPSPYAYSDADTNSLVILGTTDASGDSGIFLRRNDGATGIDIWQNSGNGDVFIDSRWAGGDINFRTQTGSTAVDAVTIAESGNLGVGTTTPGTKLDVEGVITAGYNATDYRSFVIRHNATNGGGFLFQKDGEEAFVGVSGFEAASTRRLFYGGGGWGEHDANEHHFYTDPDTGAGDDEGLRRLAINSAGDLLWGSAITNVDTAAGALAFFDASSGNIGVGTTAPAALLHVVEDASGVAFLVERTAVPALIKSNFDNGDAAFHFEVNNPTGKSYLAGIDDSDGDKFKISYGSAGDAAFGTNDYFTLDQSGNVGIGDSSPGNPLEINTTNTLGSTFENATAGEGVRVTQTDYTSGNYVSLIESAYDDANAAPNVRIGAMFDGGGSNLAIGTSNSYGSGITNTALWVSSTGQLGVGTTSELAHVTVDTDGFSGDGYRSAFHIENSNIESTLTLRGSGSGYLNANINLVASSGTDGRALGITAYDQGSQRGWFFGRPYSGSDAFAINRRSTTGYATDIADETDADVDNFFYITSSGDIGVGTSVPTAKFHVKGNVGINTTDAVSANLQIATDSDGDTAFRIVTGTNENQRLTIDTAASGSHAQIWTGNSVDLRLGVGSSPTDVVITNGGDTGFGTTDPNAPLHVYRAATTGTDVVPFLSLEISDDGADTEEGEGPGINFYIADSTTGTAAQTGAGNSHLGGQIAFVKTTATDASGSGSLIVSTASNAEDLVERIRVTHDGLIRIASGTDAVQHSILTVADGESGGNTYIDVKNNHNHQFLKVGINNNEAQLGYDNADTFAIGEFDDTSDTTIDTKFAIDSSGDATFTGSGGTCTIDGSGACSSDERLKTNIQEISGADALNKLSQLRSTTFTWVDPTWNQDENVGLIAQEVLSVFPQLVDIAETKFNGSRDDYYVLNYAGLTSPLIAAVNELNLRTSEISTDVLGNIGIGTTTPAYKLHVLGDVAATSFVNISTREEKNGISYLDEARKEDILSKLKAVQIAEYRYNYESDSNPLRLGLIAEEAPSEILSASGKGVDIYKMATFTLASVQEIALKLETLEERIAALEASGVIAGSGGVFSTTTLKSAFAELGVLIEKGFAQFDKLAFKQLIAQKDNDGEAAAGTGTIYSGNKLVLVENSQIKTSSKVFITFTAPVVGSWFITDKANGSFRVTLDQTQTSDVTFDYFIVQTERDQAPTSDTGVVDTEAPIITVLGANPYYLATGTPFVDPGVTITDNVDENLSYTLSVDGYDAETHPLDTSVAGEHVLTYKVLDTAGNLTTATRAVVVGADASLISVNSGTSTPETTATTTPPVAEEEEEEVEETPADTTAPTITLTGDAAIELTVGDSFTDLGATATDDVDGDVTGSISVTGSVDTAVAGLYTLTYTVTDTAGNEASVSRIVTVTDAAEEETVASTTPATT